MRDWLSMTAADLGKGIGTGEIDPVALTDTYLDAIDTHEARDRIYSAVTAPRARAEAQAAAERARAGLRLGPLDGVPISWKDLFDTAGCKTEAGSALLKGRVPDTDARVLRNAAHVIDRVAAEPALELVSSADAAVRSGIVTFRHRELEPAALHKRLLDAGVVCAARGGGVRFSPHCYNTAASIDRALDVACR